jgi:hypothetical protein
VITQGVTPVADGTIERSPVNKEYTTINANLAYSIGNGIVFVYIINITAAANKWTNIGTVPAEIRPPAEVDAMAFGGAYGNGYWCSCGVKPDGTVQVGNSGSSSRVNVYGTVSYPYPS